MFSIILHCHRNDDVSECIARIKENTSNVDYEIIVLENEDETFVFENQESVHVVPYIEKESFCYAINEGILTAKGDFVILLNSSVRVTPNWLEKMEQVLSSSVSIAAVGAISNHGLYYQQINIDYSGDDKEDINLFSQKIELEAKRMREERLKLDSFCVMLKRNILQKTGLLDERFISFQEGMDDLCFRIRLAGFKLMLCKNTFVHYDLSGKASFVKFQKDLAGFESKWGFHSEYHTYIRNEMVGKIEKVPQRILEIGCACGATLLQCKNIFPSAQVYGVELNESAARIARLVGDVQIGDVESGDIDFPAEFFDCVLCPDVLEHLKNPSRILKKIANSLRPEGVVIASIPNVMHFSVIKELIEGNWTYRDSGILDSTHLRFFTLSEINKLFLGSGYRIIDVAAKFRGAQTEEEQSFLQQLKLLSKMDNQFFQQAQAFQYIITAQKAKLNVNN